MACHPGGIPRTMWHQFSPTLSSPIYISVWRFSALKAARMKNTETNAVRSLILTVNDKSMDPWINEQAIWLTDESPTVSYFSM